MMSQLHAVRARRRRDGNTGGAAARRGTLAPERAPDDAGAPRGGGAIPALQARADVAAGRSHAASLGARLQAGPAVQRLSRTGAALNAGAPVQRRIDFSTTSKRFGPVIDRKGLIARARELFPLLTNVAELITEIDEQDDDWTLGQVYTVLSQRAREIPVPLSGGVQEGSILLPSDESHRRDFGFTTRTRARGFVERDEGEPVPLRDATQRSMRVHAEDDVMKQLDQLLDEGKISADDTIFITINNSPCGARCAPNLAAWFRRRWRGRMVIRYANPYGDLDEFIAAREVLQDAGIEVRSFPAERYVTGLSDKQTKRFRTMKLRRKKFRPEWNRRHRDDLSDDSDEEVRGSERRDEREPEKRSRTLRSSGEEDVVRSDRRIVTVNDRLYWLDPDETRNDGDCFYTTLIAMGVAGGRDVSQLRQLAVDNGARPEALTPGEWANQQDIAATARGLGIRITQVALGLDYAVNQVNAPVGGDGDPIHIAQIFGGHFVPLRPA